MSSDSTTRRLTAALERLQAAYPAMRFGQLVCFAAELARDQRDYGVYDVKDDELIAAIERHLIERGGGSAETSERKAV